MVIFNIFQLSSFFCLLRFLLFNLEALAHIFPHPIDEKKVILPAIGKAIANSKDWGSGRSDREKNKLLKEMHPDEDQK